MPCIFFRAVKDPKKKATAGVYGYCVGYCEEKLRIPTLEEYRKYCTADSQEGCPVFDFRIQEEGLRRRDSINQTPTTQGQK